ncbi:AbgT family transporter [Oceanobacillus sp. FSL W8-0428]|uniref:Aminobenzoyl-glutamate transporter n=1 Tax=Oceanobacillus sojae TaxID=582851 RepID=A0A511ZNZ8_9BACI|nr:AbgT family transporter [Oceanobacillus sojae]GEN89165.1 aminobenzoyl-glutamate transporter [Oceanobacillus sojae]
MEDTNHKQSKFQRVLDFIERFGNKLPHPFLIFVYLAAIIIIISAIVASFDISVTHPGTGEEVVAKSLLSGEGLLFALETMLENFTGFAPLGLVLTMMLGIGVAQGVGLFDTAIKLTIEKAPRAVITYAIAFVAVMGNIASDAAAVIVPPLAAMVFYSLGRHPVAGIAAGFAGAVGGFTANLLIAGTDALLAGITTEAARAIDQDMLITPIDNYFFMATSVFLIVLLVGLVTEKVIEPRLGKYDPKYAEEGILAQKQEKVGRIEIKALRNSMIAALVYIGVILALIWPETSVLRGEGGVLVPSPFLSNIVPIIFVFFIVVSVTYGISAKTIKKSGDIPVFMASAVKDMAPYIVLVFAIAQFIAYFNWTNLSTIIAVNSADYLQSVNFVGLPLIIIFILVMGMLNQFITSGSAQWALMAPVFVPMFMLLDFHPAFTQLAYRIGDSSTALLTPLNPYLIMVLGFMKRYDKRSGLGSIISTMIPYTIALMVGWILLMIVWFLLDLPIGPGINIRLDG